MSITRIGVVGMLLGLGLGISLGLGAGFAVAEPSAHFARGDKATPAKHATVEASVQTAKGMAHPAPRPIAASHPVNTEALDRLRETAGALTTMSLDELVTSVEQARLNVASRQMRALMAEVATRKDRVAELTAELAQPGLTPAERGVIEARIAQLDSLASADQTKLQDILTKINQITEVLTSLKLDKLKQRQIILDAVR